jgi:hypothetical protein
MGSRSPHQGGKMAAMGLPSSLARFFDRIAALDDPGRPDMAAIGEALVDLAADRQLLAPAVERLGDRSSTLGLHVPERGPRLILVHRQENESSAVHDHGVWLALAPIVGIESHRRYRPVAGTGRQRVEVVEELALGPATCTTLVPPNDIHDHGHLAGVGTPAYLLILLGDDQLRHTRSEWDPATAQRRDLLPGDRGRWLSSEPFPARA